MELGPETRHTIVRPTDYQKDGLKIIESHKGRVLVCDEMGLGKTLLALFYLQRHPEIRPALVLCPAGLKRNWRREAERFAFKTVICEGMSPCFSPSDLRSVDLAIMNYDIIAPGADGPGWYETAWYTRFKMLICDECEHLKKLTAKRTRYAVPLSRPIPHILMMSGTPMTDKPSDLFPIVNMLWPSYFDSDFTFFQHFCEAHQERGQWVFKGGRNLDQLHRLLKSKGMVRRTKRQVLPDLPAKIRKVISVEINNREEYDFAERDLVGWLATWDRVRAEKAAYALRMTRFGYLLRLAAKGKMPAVCRWIDDFLIKNQKLMVFAYHKDIISSLMERYESKYKAVVIDGSKTARQRDDNEQKFKKDPACRLLIGQNKSCGRGLNFENIPSLTVELSWDPAQHNQLEARNHRMTTKVPVTNHYILAKDTVEEKLCRILQRKQQYLDEVLDGVERTPDSLTIYDELQAAMTGTPVTSFLKKVVTLFKGGKK